MREEKKKSSEISKTEVRKVTAEEFKGLQMLEKKKLDKKKAVMKVEKTQPKIKQYKISILFYRHLNNFKCKNTKLQESRSLKVLKFCYTKCLYLTTNKKYINFLIRQAKVRDYYVL